MTTGDRLKHAREALAEAEEAVEGILLEAEMGSAEAIALLRSWDAFCHNTCLDIMTCFYRNQIPKDGAA